MSINCMQTDRSPLRFLLKPTDTGRPRCAGALARTIDCNYEKLGMSHDVIRCLGASHSALRMFVVTNGLAVGLESVMRNSRVATPMQRGGHRKARKTLSASCLSVDGAATDIPKHPLDLVAERNCDRWAAFCSQGVGIEFIGG
jgi:hypothetical protein